MKAAVLLGLLFVSLCALGEAPLLRAFPGAEGFGASTPGGRGGTVHFVTTLEDYVPGEEQPLPGSFRVAASANEFTKCVRCWHHREDVGQHAEHEELCGRCIDNIAGDGEPRAYV